MRIAAVVDPAKVRSSIIAVIALYVGHDRLDSVTQSLAVCSEIKWVSATTGRFDIMALACFRSNSDLSKFVRQVLGKMKGLPNSETFVCLRIEKGRYLQI